MHYIASELYQILELNATLFILDDVDMGNKFSHCTVIIYYDGKYLKDNSSLAFHSDCFYSVSNVKYITLSNSQVDNTAAVIYSLGNIKESHWKKEIWDRKRNEKTYMD